jgi:hypothetical protein
MRETSEQIMQGIKRSCPGTCGPDLRDGHDLGRREAYRDSIRQFRSLHFPGSTILRLISWNNW